LAQTWDPGQYLKFAGPRLRPALDLMAQVHPRQSPSTVVDLGCGVGNVTRLLGERWPAAAIEGVDGSAEMLAKARAEAADIDWHEAADIGWHEADLTTWSPARPVDVLYSNAALHWLDDHAELFPRLAGMLAVGGVLAVQKPRNHGAPSHTCMTEAAAPWQDILEPVLRPSPVAAPEVYYDFLAPHVGELEIWESVYMHVLDGDNPVVEWTKGTALKPLLDVLDEGAGEGATRAEFLADYGARIRAAYPPRTDGRTLFPFRRLFIVAVR